MNKLKSTWTKYKWFLSIWIIINIIQAIFTNLHYDEAYYWLYSQKLDWGYFDHPPMVGLLAKLGDIIHHSSLGIRLFPIVMGVFVLLGIFHLIDDNKNYKNVILFTISFPLITSHISGFLILPDAPLVFFFILYLFSYRQYLEKDNLKNTIILSIIISAMFYSKYHAGLIMLLTIISNFRLLKRKSFWLAGLISIIILIPHIYWQYNNGFPSFLYHLSDRTKGFDYYNFINHIYSQVLLAGPFSGVIIIWLAFKFKSKNQFHKTLKYITFGFYIFFLMYCFKGKVEAHWTSVSTIALIIISYKELNNHKKIKKILPYLLTPAIFLLFIARVVLASDHFESQLSFKSNFINMDDWANELDSIAEGNPVLFTNKYHNLSIYSFSKKRWIPGAPHYNSRFSQIDLNRIDSIYNGKKVFALNYGSEKKWKSENGSKNRGSFITDYYSYSGLTIDNINLFKANDSIFLSFQLINPTNKLFLLKKDNNQKLELIFSINNQLQKYHLHMLTKVKTIESNDKIAFKIHINDLLETENLLLEIGLSSNTQRVFRIRKKEYTIND
jgi:hypothetical protein